MRAATPGTILILAACILLTLVTCSVPVIKSIAFLSATIGGSGNQSGQTITLGCLGYCIGSTCAGPTIGYSFDPTQLLGVTNNVDGFSIDTSQFSTPVIKALTYTLILHPVALAACVLTLVFGILAHCGDMSLRCLNSVFASIASIVTLIAVGCDFALFIIAQKRINAVQGASASLGTALWMTLVAWILIVLSSFTFCCGCCGGSGGGRGGRKKDKSRGDDYDEDAWKANRSGNAYPDQMRMDAINAEADRKRRNQNLPKFATYETEHIESLPLKHDYEDAGGQGVRFADTSTGHGYDNGYGGYGDGYTPTAEHAQYPHSYGNAQSSQYIPGVGPGAPRTVPAATAYYDSSSSAPFSPTTYNTGSGYAMDGAGAGYNDESSMYSHGAPSMSSHYSRGQSGDNYYASESAPPVPALPAMAMPQPRGGQQYDTQAYDQAYDQGYDQSQERGYSQSHDQGHGVGYSGDTFGRGDPYDAVQQATSQASRSRVLPTAPSGDLSSGIPYSPTSPHPTSAGGGINRSANVSRGADDEFGLAVLQAGEASRVVGRQEQESSYKSPTVSRPLPSAPAQNNYGSDRQTYGYDSASDTHPPRYDG